MSQPDAEGTKLSIFEQLYEEGSSWGGSSGPGSSPYYTIEYRMFLERFIMMNRIRTIVDIGCGDWQFSKHINFSRVNYNGFDVVEKVISRNKKRFSSENVTFQVMPDKAESLPAADLLIVKDVLQHFSNDDIYRFRDEVLARYPISLITNSYEKLSTPRNVEIAQGGFRCLDLTAPPYLFDGIYLLEFGSSAWERVRTLLYRSR